MFLLAPRQIWLRPDRPFAAQPITSGDRWIPCFVGHQPPSDDSPARPKNSVLLAPLGIDAAVAVDRRGRWPAGASAFHQRGSAVSLGSGLSGLRSGPRWPPGDRFRPVAPGLCAGTIIAWLPSGIARRRRCGEATLATTACPSLAVGLFAPGDAAVRHELARKDDVFCRLRVGGRPGSCRVAGV
jgi:hypothetical protein